MKADILSNALVEENRAKGKEMAMQRGFEYIENSSTNTYGLGTNALAFRKIYNDISLSYDEGRFQ